MPILISLLLNLLISVLTALIQRWLNVSATQSPPPPDWLVDCKEEFMDRVKWRVWLGPGRMSRASRAYDLAIEQYKDLPKLGVSGDDSLKLAALSVAGIAQKLK